MTEKGSMAAPLPMEWVFASCDTEHSASAARVKCSQIARKAQSLLALCRCKPMHMFAPYHDTERASSEKIAHHRRRGSSGALRWPDAIDQQPTGSRLRWRGEQYLCCQTARGASQTRFYASRPSLVWR